MFDIRVVIFSETVEREARELLAAFNSMYIQFWRSDPFLTVKWCAISKKKFYLIEFLRKCEIFSLSCNRKFPSRHTCSVWLMLIEQYKVALEVEDKLSSDQVHERLYFWSPNECLPVYVCFLDLILQIFSYEEVQGRQSILTWCQYCLVYCMFLCLDALRLLSMGYLEKVYERNLNTF